MYKKYLLILFLLLAGKVCAQHRYYCEIKGIEKELSAGLKIIFDFGNLTSYNMDGVSGKLKPVDSKGKIIKFNSMVDAANYMVEKGWSFQQAYASSYSGKPIIHWIFYKDADSIEGAKEGILFKNELKEQTDKNRQGN